MNLQDLQKPFDPRDIEWRIGRSGVNGGGKVWAMALAYLTNRAVMNRLDEVCGPENWRNEFKEWNVGGAGVLCGISIKVSSGVCPEWITKWDGAPTTDFEAVKGGLSDAQKRAAVQWGIGRLYYQLEETFVETSLEKRQGWKYGKTKDDKAFWWKEPTLPHWALPQVSNMDDMISELEAETLWSIIRKYDFAELDFLAWASKAAKRQVLFVQDLPKSLYEKAKALLEAEGSKV